MDLWSKVLFEIEKSISKPSFDTWFASTTAKVDDDLLIVCSKNKFASEWLEERYKSLIFDKVRQVAGETYEIEFYSLDSASPIQEEVNNTNREPFRARTTETMDELINSLTALEERVNKLEKLLENKDCSAENEKDSGEEDDSDEIYEEKTSAEMLKDILSEIKFLRSHIDDIKDSFKNEISNIENRILSKMEDNKSQLLSEIKSLLK
jgi:Mg2+ and Co2+ transporter CorA